LRWGGSPFSRADTVDAFKTAINRYVQLKRELNRQKQSKQRKAIYDQVRTKALLSTRAL